MACLETSLESPINELPDDILVHILSCLTLKEAGQTSILSKRWRNIWAYVPSLNFDNDKFLLDFFAGDRSNVSSVVEEEAKYVRWVDQVMTSLKAPTIDEFKVQFNLLSSHEENVDSWVRSIMEKKVKRFRLSVGPIPLGTLGDFWDEQGLMYIIPSLDFDSLTSLELFNVDVYVEDLEKVLHDCPLEYLSLFYPGELENLKIVGPSLKLKTLRLTLCIRSPGLEISAPNLTSLYYNGPVLDFPFKNNPKLTEVSIGGPYGIHLLNDFSSLSSYASQIEVLTLEACFFDAFEYTIAEAFPVCTRLKMLDLTTAPKHDTQLFGLLPLIKACPLLHKLILEFETFNPELERAASTRNIEACPHHSLKIVEFKGFVGWEVDVGFVEYLIQNAVSLEKIIIELLSYDSSYENEGLEVRKSRARLQAEQLRANLKPGTELQICGDAIYEFKLLPE